MKMKHTLLSFSLSECVHWMWIVSGFNRCAFRFYKALMNLWTIDLCYGSVPGAFRSLPMPPFGTFYHNSVLLLQIYQPICKWREPPVKTVKCWMENSIARLQPALIVQIGMLSWVHQWLYTNEKDSCSGNVKTRRHIFHQCLNHHFSLVYCIQCRTAKCTTWAHTGSVIWTKRETVSEGAWKPDVLSSPLGLGWIHECLLKMNEHLFGANSCWSLVLIRFTEVRKYILPLWVWKQLSSPSPAYSWILYELTMHCQRWIKNIDPWHYNSMLFGLLWQSVTWHCLCWHISPYVGFDSTSIPHLRLFSP